LTRAQVTALAAFKVGDATAHRFGVLGKDVPVRLSDISATGCSFELNCRLEAGWIGRVHVSFLGEEYSDLVRITRCDRSTGALYRAGAEFFLMPPPGPKALRRVVEQLSQMEF
jgi:hypothetical protein